ncbi:uncharacterized protein LDX57_000013 [Aspergillus melleus]|uniref:uncharacterized protein n=1 Tax=Aspergillus melleus TaxID=138277 RepID=UPI001E8CA851|nr:uncharacterized protein LDX57_000013 [Aspergillus melleus]KAH8422255.1 hypothetical protein LDX57_000013 [Aspergillus melleus]
MPSSVCRALANKALTFRLYLLFAAYPIVYQRGRGWSEGIGSLAFVGILVGNLFAAVVTFLMYFGYKAKCLAIQGRVPPEALLPDSFIAAIALPAGLFWFSWTHSPSAHYRASIAAGVPFGYGMVMVFLPVLNYLIDAYTIYAACAPFSAPFSRYSPTICMAIWATTGRRPSPPS